MDTYLSRISFEIVSEIKNVNSWKYSVKYEERLSHWPYVRNYATANIVTDFNYSDDIHFINSTHRTCFLKNTFCLESKGTFLIHSNLLNSVVCKEHVIYQCPIFMSLLCLREVVYQRNHILGNLKKHFDN
ncbi:uncharacterized protein LOC112905168 [Agrilus planipennis]|uniref:Uncharacterized protein LOC112905168 n=1 Tax=Agrilus planipennis TaxID=224129 RepID=A0A7F5RA57_AGRPL|nr:uncharacterized protein LOC112905168 [Agrilus planipennis]